MRVGVANGTFASPATRLVGDVSFYDSSAAGTVTAGMPTNPEATHLVIKGANDSQNSFKAQTAVDQNTIMAITEGERTATLVDISPSAYSGRKPI